MRRSFDHRNSRRGPGRPLHRDTRAAADAAREGTRHRAESARRHVRIRSRLLRPGAGVPRGRRPRDPRSRRAGDGALARHDSPPPAGRGDARRSRILRHWKARADRDSGRAGGGSRGDDALRPPDSAHRRAGRRSDCRRRRTQLPGPSARTKTPSPPTWSTSPTTSPGSERHGGSKR